MSPLEVDRLFGSAVRRRVEVLASPLIEARALHELQREIASDRLAFPTQADLWAFLLAAVACLRTAQIALQRVEHRRQRLDHLAKVDRAAWARMGSLARRSPRLARLHAQQQAPQSRRPGRKNETALRDTVVRTIASLYPVGRRAGRRWPVAVRLAALVWPDIPDAEDLRRDMRRRAARRLVESPELAELVALLSRDALELFPLD